MVETTTKLKKGFISIMVSNTTFFSQLLENQFSLSASMTFAISISVIVPLLLYSIIWYERNGNDNKRTLVNAFASLACRGGIEYLVVAQMLECIYFIFGPMPVYFCFLARILRSAIFIEIILFFDLMIISRYFYIFLLKNVSILDEQFWTTFFHYWVKLFCIVSMIAWHLIVTKQPFNYYICLGTDPGLAFLNPPRKH